MLTIHNTEQDAKKLCEFISREKITPIFDIDGVIADASHRISLNDDGSLNLARYIEATTAENVSKDKPLALAGVVNFCNITGIGYAVATARYLCEHSYKWLANNRVNPFLVWSRPSGDKSKDYELKSAHFNSDIPEYLRPLYCLIDDNLDNCKAAERLGMRAVHVVANVRG